MLLSFAKICHVVILTYGENIAGIDVHVWMEMKWLYCELATRRGGSKTSKKDPPSVGGRLNLLSKTISSIERQRNPCG